MNSRTQIITKIVQVIIFQPPALFSDACQYWSRQCAERRYDGGGGKSICQSEKLFVRNIKTNGIIKLLKDRKEKFLHRQLKEHISAYVFVRDREKQCERVLVFLWRCEILMETSSRYRMLMVFFLSLKQASLLWALLVLLFILKLWLCLMDVFTCISALRRLWGNVSSISINYMQKSEDGCNFAWQTTTHELRQRCERAQRLQIDFPCFSPIESAALQLVSSELVLWGKM